MFKGVGRLFREGHLLLIWYSPVDKSCQMLIKLTHQQLSTTIKICQSAIDFQTHVK